jgi:ribonuclease-3
MPIDDASLYRQALTHRSVVGEQPERSSRSYERLEYLGDALLDFIVADVLYHRFPERNEGFLTRLRAKLVSKSSLAQYAREMGVGPLLRMTGNAARSGERENASLLSDAFESLLAAVYLDHGHEAARQFVNAHALESLDLEAVARREQNFKSLLQEHLQAEARALPSYRVVDAQGPSHATVYTVEVCVDGEVRGQGTARSKQRAEQKAAAEALAALRDVESVPLSSK